MAIDSHMHINSLYTQDKLENISKVNNDINLEKVVNVGINIPTSKEVIEMTELHPKIYGSVGIHPLHIKNQKIEELYGLADNPKIVAIGEIGIDTLNGDLNNQINYFIRQIEVANYFELPVIIHSNNANKIIIDIFKYQIKPKYGCVFHCFQPDLEDLAYLVQQGYYVSFAGRITYRNAKKSIEVIENVPDDLFLVETDAPFMPPYPFEKYSINYSKTLPYVIKRIAEIKNKSYEEIEDLTVENTKRLFRKMI